MRVLDVFIAVYANKTYKIFLSISCGIIFNHIFNFFLKKKIRIS